MKVTSWQALEREINPQLLPPLILIQSKDAFELRETALLLLEKLKKPYKRVSIEDMDHLVEEMCSFSLFSAPLEELILIEHIEAVKSLHDEFFQKRQGRCIIVTSTGTPAQLIKKIDAFGLILDIPEVKPWEKQGKLQDWIMALTVKQGKRIQRDAVELLAKEYLTDRFSLEKELQKLYLYTAEKNDITLKDVLEISCVSDKANLWNLSEMILQRNVKEALKILDGLDFNDLHPLQVVRALRNQIREALELSTLNDARTAIDDIRERFPQIKGKFLDKKLNAATYYGTMPLRKAVVALDKLEVDLKNASLDEELALEKLVINLSTAI